MCVRGIELYSCFVVYKLFLCVRGIELYKLFLCVRGIKLFMCVRGVVHVYVC